MKELSPLSKIALGGEKVYATAFALTLIILAPVALATLIDSASISSSGRIDYSLISPLHVDGRYIKDNQNNIIYLRGINKNGFEDDPGGSWGGSLGWDANIAAQEFDAMKTWGINVVRMHQAVEHWKNNLGNHRQVVKDMLTIAARKRMYIIYDLYSVTNAAHGGDQDPLPYPPWQISSGASSIIANSAEFVSVWSSIASELKGYPNVLFELWNEPVGDYSDSVIAQWLGIAQQAINAIRATGAQQLIVVGAYDSVWCNIDNPGDVSNDGTVSWISRHPITDPSGNILYTTHFYRRYGSTGYDQNNNLSWQYNDISTAMHIEMLDWAGDTMNVPLLIGETGCNYGASDFSHELSAWNSTLTLYNQLGLHYTAFWWHTTYIWRLLQIGYPNFTPNEAGQMLIDALSG